LITVSENEIRAAVRELALRARLVAEPSGAVALAAYRQGSTPPGRTVMILSGGNIEPTMLQEILADRLSHVRAHLIAGSRLGLLRRSVRLPTPVSLWARIQSTPSISRLTHGAIANTTTPAKTATAPIIPK